MKKLLHLVVLFNITNDAKEVGMTINRTPTARKVGLVFLQGGVTGAVEPGMLSVIWRRGLVSHNDRFVIVGSSVGAINAAGCAEYIAKGVANPGRSLERTWEDRIRTPEDIARLPVTIYELFLLPRHIWKGWQEPEERVVRRFRITEALYRFFSRRVWRCFPKAPRQTLCAAGREFRNGWHNPREKLVPMGRIRSVFRRLRLSKEISLFYPPLHMLAFTRYVRRLIYEASERLRDPTKGVADRTPIDELIGSIDFAAVERARDRLELVVVTTAESGPTESRPRYFSSHEHSPSVLHQAVRASIAYPPMIGPVEIEGTVYGDGGASDIFPVQQALDRGCEVVYVFCTTPKDSVPFIDSVIRDSVIGSFPAILRTIWFLESRSMNTYRLVREHWRGHRRVHLIEPIEIPLTVTSRLSFQDESDIRTMLRLGREAATNYVDNELRSFHRQ